MFDVHSIIRFMSILLRGMIVSSITGFVGANDVSTNDCRVCLVTVGLIVLVQNLIFLVYEMPRLYDKIRPSSTTCSIRGGLILQSSILALGLSDVGLGFGVFGFIMFLVNILAGVFVDNNPINYIKYFTESAEENNELTVSVKVS